MTNLFHRLSHRWCKEFIDSLLFTDIVLLIQSLPEPVRVGHARNRIWNLQGHFVYNNIAIYQTRNISN